MIHPEDSDGDGDRSDEDDGRAVAVKNDPQFTLAVTRGRFTHSIKIHRWSLGVSSLTGLRFAKVCLCFANKNEWTTGVLRYKYP